MVLPDNLDLFKLHYLCAEDLSKQAIYKTLYLLPPYCTSAQELEQFYENISTIIAEEF